MPTLATLRKALAAGLMLVGALYCGAKTSADQRGAVSVMEIGAHRATVPVLKAPKPVRPALVSQDVRDFKAVGPDQTPGAVSEWPMPARLVSAESALLSGVLRASAPFLTASPRAPPVIRPI